MEDGAYDDVASQSTDVSDRIRVCLRVRPPIAGDSIVTVDDDVTVRLEGARESLAAQFDGVFDGDASQRDVRARRRAGGARVARGPPLHRARLRANRQRQDAHRLRRAAAVDPKPPPAEYQPRQPYQQPQQPAGWGAPGRRSSYLQAGRANTTVILATTITPTLNWVLRSGKCR